jgi:hypothetical protein
MAVQYAFGKIITQGLDLNVDAADPTSYPGSGNHGQMWLTGQLTAHLYHAPFHQILKVGLFLIIHQPRLNFRVR